MTDIPNIEDILRQVEGADPTEAPMWVHHLMGHPELQEVQGPEAFRAARALSVHATQREMIPLAAQLAKRAHSAGIPGAGALYAECTDKTELMSGRAQTFGTVTMTYQGDIVLASTDPSTPDEARAEIGLPPFSVMKENIDRRNRAAAIERAESGKLPNGQRFGRIWREPRPDAIRSLLTEHPEGSWADGDELTFATISDASGVLPGPVFELPMWRLEEDDGSPSDVFVLTVKVERLSEAVVGYGFWSLDETGMVVGGGRGPIDHRFRGTDAPAQLPSNEDHELKGTLDTHLVESEACKEARKVTVYLPPDHTRDEELPVVYATDGNMFSPYARRLDAAMDAGTIPRAVIVAAHSARMDQYGNERALEYILGQDDQRFDRHQRFFVSELSAWAEREFGVSSEREHRAIFGCSDGAGHALATGHMHHQRYAHCIAYSTGMPPNEQMRWDPEVAPFVHLCAGTLEGPFHQATEAWAAWLHMFKSPHDWTERICGHDLIQWIEELPRAINRAWGDAA